MKEKLLELQTEHDIEETFWNLQEFFKSLPKLMPSHSVVRAVS